MKLDRLVGATLAASLVFPTTGCGGEASRPRPKPAISTPSEYVSEAMTGLSLGDTLYDLNDAELAKRLDMTRALGQALRIDIDWARLRPTENAPYAWDATDRVVAEAKKRGLVVLGMIGFAPVWARDPACVDDYGCAPEHDAEFAAFAGDAAEHFKQDITTYEIWNEPNTERFFGPKPDAPRYARMLTLASEAIAKANPTARLASGGLAAGYDDGTNIAPVTFLQKMYAAGARGFSAVAVHPYNAPARPSQAYAWSAFTQIEGDEGIANMPTIHSVMAANGDANKEVWLTEYGAPTHGPGHKATLENQRFEDFDALPGAHVDEPLQAAMIDEFLHYRFKKANVTVRIAYTLVDTAQPGSADDTEHYFGVYNQDGTPKKAVTVFTKR